MKLISIFFFILTINCLAKETKKPIIEKNKSPFLICLSSLYGAEASYFAENEFYTDELVGLGFNSEINCKGIDLRVYSPGGDQFIAYAKKDNIVWSIDHKKRIVNLKK